MCCMRCSKRSLLRFRFSNSSTDSQCINAEDSSLVSTHVVPGLTRGGDVRHKRGTADWNAHRFACGFFRRGFSAEFRPQASTLTACPAHVSKMQQLNSEEAKDAHVQGMVLVATQEICDGELFLDYRYNPNVKLPAWYKPVNIDENHRRWAA